MANLTIIGKPPGKAGGTLDDHLDGEFTDEYLIQTDMPLVRREEILECEGLPVLFAKYDSNALTTEPWFYFYVKELDAKQSPDSPFLWIVTVKYSTRISEEARQTLSPLDRPPLIKKRSQRATRAREYDDDGLPLVNSAALPFDPPYESEESNTLLTAMRYEVGFDHNRHEDLVDSVNSTFWAEGLPGTWKCVGIDADEDWQRGMFCVQVVYSFLHKHSGWTGYHARDAGGNDQVLFPSKTRILDRGKVERVNGKINWIYDTRGHPVPDPVCLDGRGLRLDSGPDRFTKTTQALLAAGTTVTVFNQYSLVQGQRATIYQEDIIIDSIDIAAKTLTVVRGVGGTTAADYAVGDVIYQKSGASTELIAVANPTDDFVRVRDPLVFGFVVRTPGAGALALNPDIQGFIRIGREEMRVTSVVSANFNAIPDTGRLGVERGANGTANVEHLLGVEVRQAPTFLNFSLLKYRNFGALNLGL